MKYFVFISFYLFSTSNTTINAESDGDNSILIVGLGNPGKEYSKTRHNIGFMIVEELVQQYHSSFGAKAKFHCEMCKVNREKQKLIFVKPTTYMNLSGKSVIALKMYYNILNKNIFVIHDDIDLAVGRIKIKFGGGNGGHNGLKSIDQVISTKYNRIRVGVGKPNNKFEVVDYVVKNFNESDSKLIEQAIDKVVNNFNLVLDDKLNEFRNKIL